MTTFKNQIPKDWTRIKLLGFWLWKYIMVWICLTEPRFLALPLISCSSCGQKEMIIKVCLHILLLWEQLKVQPMCPYNPLLCVDLSVDVVARVAWDLLMGSFYWHLAVLYRFQSSTGVLFLFCYLLNGYWFLLAWIETTRYWLMWICFFFSSMWWF